MNMAVEAQDVRFSDFYETPLILNPGNTGNFEGNWRLMNNYRRQGINTDDPYVTKVLTFEHPLYFLNERAAGGLTYVNDVSGYGMLKVNKLYGSLAYFKKISQKSYIHTGFQAGMVHKRFSTEGITFPDQYDMTTGYYNTNLSTQEALNSRKLVYLDLSWGLLWSRRGERVQTEAGIAMFHYNRPEESFFGQDVNLPVRWAMHVYPDIKISPTYFFEPKALFVYQNGASELLMGSDITYRANDSKLLKAAFVGAYFRAGFNRSPDLTVIKVGAKLGDFRLSLAFDKELSGALSGIHTKEAFELSVIYIAPLTKLDKRIISCELF
jgi:type IX secretion system PorP/SprF family membrane protein